MYELTESEGATILSILAEAGPREVPWRDPREIPESTYYAIRKKAYDGGWLTDRYVPNPWVLGFSAVEAILVRPGISERASLERAWAASPSNVVLWSGLNSLFGVFFRREGEETMPDEGARLRVTPTSGSIPAYFDYSRLWSRFIGREGTTGYPRSLATAGHHPERAHPHAMEELFRRDRGPERPAVPPRPWHPPSGLPRSQQRLLDWGLLQDRTFLNAERLPPFRGRIPSEVVYLQGRLRPGFGGGEVLSRLSSACGVSPFLVADDGHRILIATLGQLESEGAGRRRVSATAQPVLPTLERMVDDVEVTIERTDSLRKVTDHRYESLFVG